MLKYKKQTICDTIQDIHNKDNPIRYNKYNVSNNRMHRPSITNTYLLFGMYFFVNTNRRIYHNVKKRIYQIYGKF